MTASASAPNIDGEFGYISIKLNPVIENPLINAIEIEGIDVFADTPAAPAPSNTPTSFQDIRITCGYDKNYVDSLGNTWLPDQYFSGGMTWSKLVSDILSTVDDGLFFHERIGERFFYNIPVPEATYVVTLLFAENYYKLTGQRVFDIKVENLIREKYDILGIVQPITYTNLVFYPFVSDGTLSIELKRIGMTGGFPKLNAIKVQLDKPHFAHAVASGPYYSTISNNLSSTVKILLKGETSHIHGPGSYITNSTWKKGSAILGQSLNLDYDFTVGNHTISLMVADSGGDVHTDVATVSIRPFGYPTVTQLSPNSGNLSGNFLVTINGSGFNYSATQTTVQFGQTVFTGTNLKIIDPNTLSIVCPPTSIGRTILVTVTTPLGVSEPDEFNYVGGIPIQWATSKFMNVTGPTVAKFGPDKKLYIGTSKGQIVKATMNDDFNQVTSSLTVVVIDIRYTM